MGLQIDCSHPSHPRNLSRLDEGVEVTSIFEKDRLNREETDDRSSAFRRRRSLVELSYLPLVEKLLLSPPRAVVLLVWSLLWLLVF